MFKVEILLKLQLESLHSEIAELLNDKNWLLNGNKQILERLNEHWVQKIDTNIYLLKKKYKLDEGHLIAELSFGFWTALLSGPFEHKKMLWPQLKSKVFPNAHGSTIDYIRKQFDKIRSLRNRIFHYGSIWHWKNLPQQHDVIIDAIKWIDPSLLYLIQIDRFKDVYAKGPQMIRNRVNTEILITEDVI